MWKDPKQPKQYYEIGTNFTDWNYLTRKTYYIAIATKNDDGKEQTFVQGNRMKTSNINSHKYSQRIFEGLKKFKGEKLVCPTNNIEEIVYAK